MMKKLLAIAIVAALMMSMVVFAAPANLTGVITDLDRTPPIRRTLEVPVDMKVDVGQTGTYADGPITETLSGSSVYANYKATIYMSDVQGLFSTLMDLAGYYVAGESDLETRLDNSIISGNFTIKIVYPGTAVVPNSILTGTALEGFNDAAATTFEETVPRTVTNGTGGTKELTITLSVKPGITAGAMKNDLQRYLPNITFTCAGVSLGVGTNEVIGTITGQTSIYDDNADPTPDDLICEITYTGKQGTAGGVTGGAEISETVILNRPASGGSPIIPSMGTGSSGGEEKPSKPIEVEVKIPSSSKTETVTIPEGTKNPTINVDELAEELNPTREGFVFAGFYADQFYTQKLEGDVPVTKDTTIYGRFVNITVPEIFEKDNHVQYIYGYTDGTVKPENNVTREEITAMLYRLLKPEVREKLETSENSFSDVAEDRWSNIAISSMAKGGYLYGYTDGTFNPEGDITRGELAAIVSRFTGSIIEGERDFNDISGHWAEESIKSVANNEWIFGYTDGSFRPDTKITRAEAVAIINRVVVRYVAHEGLTGTEKIWPDNPTSAWYYYSIIEASHNHDYEREEGQYSELWSTSSVN